MLSSVTLDDKDGTPVTLHSETGKRVLANATGLAGIGAPRESRRDRPTAHGGIDDSKWESGRLIVLDGEVFSTAGIADAFTEFRQVTKPMLQTLDHGPALLRWTEGTSGLALQRKVKLASDVDPPLSDGAAALSYQCQLFAEDPRAYSQTLTTATGAALSAATGGLTFTGGDPLANIVRNPSFEVNAAGGWSVDGTATLTRTFGLALNGSYHGKAEFPASTTSGIRLSVTREVRAGETYILALYARRSAGSGSLNVQFVTAGETQTQSFTPLDGAYERNSFTWTPTVDASALDVVIRPSTATASTVLFESVSLMKGSTLRTYFDGDTAGYSWLGAAHESASVENTVKGGLIFPFKFTPSGGGSAICTNAGNRPTPPVFRIHGMATNPQITLEGTSERIVLNGTVQAGDFLDVDVAKRNVVLNGQAARNNFVDSAKTTWPDLPVGTSTVRLIAETFNETARCDVSFRGAYA